MKFKKYAAAIALAASALGAQAGDLNNDLGVINAGDSATFSGAIVAGDFFDIYSFELSSAGSLVGSFASAVGMTLTQVKLAGEGAYRYLTLGSDLNFSYSDLPAGYYALYVFGSSAEGSYNGTITAQPVPEPETYAMLLAGLGVMGVMAARRRKSL